METLMLMAIAIPVVTAVAVYSRRDSTGAWQEVAKRTGLELRGLGTKGKLEGSVGNADIIVDIVEKVRERKSTSWTRIRATTDIPPGLLVGGEGFWREWNAEQGEDVVDMAGVAFDEHVIVRGAVPQIFALLNNDTRSQFRELEKRYRAFVVDGSVHVEQSGVARDSEALSRLIRRVATMAMALSLHGPSIADRLGANVATDSNALVRLRNLELLLDRYADSESARLACQHALTDRSHAVAVLAAQHCGAEGIATFERVLEDLKAEHTLRYQCLEHLVGLVDLDSAVSLLLHTVDTDPALKATALVTLASIGYDPGADVLASLLADESPEGWIAYAQCISALGREEMTEPLELLLSGDTEQEVVTFIFQALEPDNEDLKDTAPLTLPIPEELRMDLEVQEAAQDAMRNLAGWSFDDEEDSVPLDEDNALEGELAPAASSEDSDEASLEAPLGDSEAMLSGSLEEPSEVELEPQVD